MQRLRQRLRGERGSVAVEFALIVPVFLVLVYGGLSFGMAMSAKSIVTEAAADGARAAIGVAPPSCQSAWTQACTSLVTSAATTEASSVLSNEGAAYATYAPPSASVANCSITSSSQCITVTISYPYSAHPVLPNLPGFGLILPSTLNATYTVEVTP